MLPFVFMLYNQGNDIYAYFNFTYMSNKYECFLYQSILLAEFSMTTALLKKATDLKLGEK